MSRLFAAYLLLSGLALAGPSRPPAWPLLALAHVGLAFLALAAPGRGGVPTRERWGASVGWIRDLWPLLAMPLLYAELPLLSGAVHGKHYFDELVIGWERALLGFEPARAFSAAAPWPLLSEAMHASYIAYYPIIYVPPLLIAWRAGRNALRETVFTLSLVFFAHYLFFVWFPVEGPYYRFEGPPEAVRGWPAYRLAHAILDAGASRGAAFPSSHVGVAIAAAVACWRHLRTAAPFVTGLALALALGAVYGGFHYAVDALAGGLLGLTLALLAPRVRAALEPVADPAGALPRVRVARGGAS